MKITIDMTQQEIDSLKTFQKYRYEFEEYREMLNWQEVEELDEILLKIASKTFKNDLLREG